MQAEQNPTRTMARKRRFAVTLGSVAIVALFLAQGAALAIQATAAPSARASSPDSGSSAAIVHPLGIPVLPGSTITVPLPSAGSSTLTPTQIVIPALRSVRASTSNVVGAMALAGHVLGGHALAPHHPAVSTASNWYVDSSECSQSSGIAQVGANPMTLVQGIENNFGLFNGSLGPDTSSSNGVAYYPIYSNTTPCTPAGSSAAWSFSNFTRGNGTAEIARSTNGGVSWTDSWLTENGSWRPAHATNLGQVFNNSLNASMPDGVGKFASNANGSLLMFATMFDGACDQIYYNIIIPYNQGSTGLPCTSAQLLNQTAGVAVATSTNGGISWNVPHQVFKTPTWVDCSGAGQFGQTNITENPSITMNPSNGHAVVIWDNVVIQWTTSCTGSVTQILSYRSVSSNNGVTWSVPAVLFAGKAGTGFRYGGQLPAVGVGPGPSYEMYATAVDYGNFTAGPTLGIQISHSTTNGASWSTPSAIVSSGINALSAPGTPPGSGLRQLTITPGTTPPDLAVDNWTSSTHKGNLYVAWTDNLSGTDAGYPGIVIAASANSGSTFTTATLSNSSHTWTYWNPSLSVAPDGTLWLSFLAVNANDGSIRMMGSTSSDAGSTWSTIFPIQDTQVNLSAPPPGPNSLGPRFGLVSTAAGTFASWTDTRLSNLTTTFDTEVLMTQMFSAKLNTSGANATITGSVYGTTTKFSANYLGFDHTVWANGANQSYSAPLTVPYNSSDVGAFQSWSGAASGTNGLIKFTSTSGGTLTANYKLQAAAVIAGTIQLAQTVNANPAYMRVTIDGSAVPLSTDPGNSAALMFQVAVTGTGDHVVVGSAVGSAASEYVSITNSSVPATPGVKTTVPPMVLARTDGSITGHLVIPAGTTYAATTVLLNGTTTVTVDPSTGFINFNVSWGSYSLTATNPVTTSYTNPSVIVTPFAATPVSPTLNGGWIAGNIQPGSLTTATGLSVTVSGAGSAVTYQGASYNVSRVAGSYTVTATSTGYTTVVKQVTVVAGKTIGASFTLSNGAYVVGTIGPASALANASKDKLSVNLQNASKVINSPAAVNTTTGDFNASVHAGWNYVLQVSETGYKTQTFTVKALAPGAASAPFTVTLVSTTVTPPNCHTNNSCPTSTKNSSGSSGLPLTLIIAAIGVLALVAIVAVVLLMRRRGSGGGGGGSSDDEAASPPEGASGAAPTPEWSEPENPS